MQATLPSSAQIAIDENTLAMQLFEIRGIASGQTVTLREWLLAHLAAVRTAAERATTESVKADLTPPRGDRATTKQKRRPFAGADLTAPRGG